MMCDITPAVIRAEIEPGLRPGPVDAVAALRLFVAEYFDGSLARCMELDRLLWEVRLANRHVPDMLHYEGSVPSAKGKVPAKLGTQIDLDELLANSGPKEESL